MAFFGRAADLAEADDDLDTRIAAVLGPGPRPAVQPDPRAAAGPAARGVRHHDEPAPRARLAAALARCWAYADEPPGPGRSRSRHWTSPMDWTIRCCSPTPSTRRSTSHWGPDDLARRRDWAVRLDDAAAHLRDPDARLQAQLWGLTVAWEVLDLPGCTAACAPSSCWPRSRPGPGSSRRRDGCPRAAAPQRRGRARCCVEQAEAAAAEAVIPDAEAMLHGMRGYLASVAGDAEAVQPRRPSSRATPSSTGVAVVRAEAAIIWLGAGRLDKVAGDGRRRSHRTCWPSCPATPTGCSSCSACSRARSRSAIAS